MEIGAHLPLMDFGGHPYTLDHLLGYARAAARLRFDALTANDHLVFSVPWLDGPTALAAVLGESSTMTLATTITLAAVRGPVPVAKALAAIDRLSGGRLVVGLGPGSSAADYEAVGLDFDERWTRLEEAARALRALWRADSPPYAGRYYSTAGIDLAPGPARPEGPPIWIGSWGSVAGLRRLARVGDGWLASAYNTTPDLFAQSLRALREDLVREGRDPDGFPNALATMWFHITDDRAEADRVLRDRVIPIIHRPEDVLRARLPIGPAEAFAEKLHAFRDAGVQRVYIWPVTDEIRQLERFSEQVRPRLA